MSSVLESSTLEEKASVCPLDCGDACSLTATVKDGTLVKVSGSKANPITQGVVCGKVAKFYPEFIHGDRRLTQPLRRVGAKGSSNLARDFEVISWDEALDLCYEGLQKGIKQFGSESVMPLNYAGPHGQLAGASMDMRFFYKLGATQLNRSPLCAGVRSLSYTSLFGSSLGLPMEQMEHSDLIVLWGVNTTTSYLHMMKIIKKARAKGAKVIVIDPKRIKVSKIADLYLQVTPASDVYLAQAVTAECDRQGMIDHEALKDKVSGLDEYLDNAKQYDLDKVEEICGIAPSQIIALIGLLKNAKRMSMMVGVGVERSHNGGSSIRSAMALSVLLGQFGHLGQGQMGYYSPAFNKTPDHLQRPDLLAKPTRTFNIVDASDHILDREQETPVKTVFIYNHNAVAMHPDQNKMIKALSQDDVFVIGCDITMTDTMKYADIILPACSHFEHAEVYSAYGHTYLQRADAAIEAVGEALPNTEIFRRLSKRFGFEDAAFQETDEQLQEQAFDLSSHSAIENKVYEISPTSPISMTSPEHLWLSDLAGKVTLFNDELEEQYGYGLPRFERLKSDHPFVLLTPAGFHRSNSTFGGCNIGLEEVDVNPADAKTLAINDGQRVKLSNKFGEVILKARVTDEIARGVLLSPKGAWCESSPTGQTVNALLDTQCKTDIGDGAAFYDTFVDLSVV
ncbi:MAG TPA: molybdopterin oxidoreductase family protein [Leucothrix mucor]|nr:molybdopterin oxidoreductase family protein [Leucothrix mucor]